MGPGKSPHTVACPTCRKPVRWSAEEKFKPFCSERCQLIDLGDWATEAYKIPDREESEPPDGTEHLQIN